MKRILFHHFQIFQCNKLVLNTQIPRYCILQSKLKLHRRNVFQVNVCNIHTTSIKALSENRDKLSPEVEVIYQAPQTKIVKRMKLTTLVIGTMAVTAQPLLFFKGVALKGALFYGLEGALCFMTVMPIFLHLFMKGYVSEITYDEKNKLYIATLFNFFLRKKFISFHIEDVKPTEAVFTSCYAKGEPLILFEECFSDVSHFIKLKGYDKPIDINLESHLGKEAKAFEIPKREDFKSEK